MKKILFPLSLLSCLAMPNAHAADGLTPEQCAKLNDNDKRLACYDEIFAPNQVETETKTVVNLDKTYEKSKAKRETSIVLEDSQIAPPSKEDEVFSSLTFLYDLDKNNPKGILSVREHEPNYIMPAWYNSSPNRTPYSPTRGTADNDIHKNQKRIETKMQMSFKTKLMQDVFKTKADLWFGYTQQSNWQMYNLGDDSAPFRNNDYAPEVFLTQPVKAVLPWGGKLKVLGAGYVHHSNGQSRPLSRSWNRGYVFAGMEWGNLTVIPRAWMRMDTDKGEKDDNPDIMRYMGYGDVKFVYKFNEKHAAAATVRFNPRHGYGAIQADYVFPIKGKLKGYVRGFHGYGENLLEYNHKQTGIGLGVMLQGWDKR